MEKEKAVILQSLSDYYRGAKIEVPFVEQREFGVGGFRKKIESRHLSFASNDALKNYLVHESPLYISHSIAYYRYPEATPMQNKEWLSGDLVFDLDVHCGLFLSADESEKVKNDAIKLEDILKEEFGVKDEEIIRVFSGGRGFHLHVKAPRFGGMDGDARREIADYVAGTGLNFNKFFDKVDKYRVMGPKKSDWGYRGRFCRIIEKTLEKKPSLIHRGLKKEEEKNKVLSCIEEGNWSKTPIKDIVERTIKVAEKEMRLETVDVDTGVTIDIKRLIRVPNTIHGSTGLVAKKLDAFEDFEPYRDALAFGVEPLKIKALENLGAQEFADSTIEKIEKGEEKEVPRSYGMYLIMKEIATLS